MYTPTTIRSPSARSRALAQELTSLVEERRARDPELGVPDTLIALELVKASLLEDAGIAAARGKALAVAAAALALAVAGFAFFLVGH